MGFLTEYEDPTILFCDKKYPLDLAYDTVLNVQRMFRDRLLGDDEMLLAALDIFLGAPKVAKSLGWPERADLLNRIYEDKIAARPRPRTGSQQKLVDFEEDGEYIYASFMQDYGIDLIDQQGRLPWQRFLALFQGLSDKTKIKEIMRIRGMELPKPNKTNQKEIRDLIELKAFYALGYCEDGGKEGLERLFLSLEGMANA